MGGILAPEIPLYGFNMTEAQRRTPNTRMVKSLRTQVTLGRLLDTLGWSSFALATLVILSTLLSLTSSSTTPSSPHPLPLCHLTLHHYLPIPFTPLPQGVDPAVKNILDEVRASVLQEELLKARNKSSEAAQMRVHRGSTDVSHAINFIVFTVIYEYCHCHHRYHHYHNHNHYHHNHHHHPFI